MQRREKINFLRKLLYGGNNEPRVTQKHCDLFNKYRNRKDKYTLEHFNFPTPALIMYWECDEKREQFDKELEALPPLPRNMIIINVVNTTVE